MRSVRVKPISCASRYALRRRLTVGSVSFTAAQRILAAMPRKLSTDAGTDALPLYMRLALGLDRSWVIRGRCLRTNGDMSRAWVVDPRRNVTFSDGSVKSGWAMREYALTECRLCPVQWDCAIFAVKSEATTAIWSAPLDDLRKFTRRFTDWEHRIRTAERYDVPVQVMLRRAAES